MLEINFTLVIFAISFLIFISLLNLTLYKPVGDIIEARKGLIEGEYQNAKELTTKSNNLLEDYKTQIKNAKHEAQNIIQISIESAQNKKQEKVSNLLRVLNNEKESALKQIKLEQASVIKQLEGQINTLKDLITNKILGMEDKTLAGTR